MGSKPTRRVPTPLAAGGVIAGKDDLDDGAGDQDIKSGTRVMKHTR